MTVRRYSHGTLQVISAPPLEPVTTAEAKLHLRVEDDSTEDSLIALYIKAAREYVERYTRRALVQQSLRDNFDCFAEEMILSRGPVQSVNSITYFDQNGDQQTLSTSAYETDTVEEPGRVVRAYNATYPVTRDNKPNCIQIDYTAGYEDDASPTDASGVPDAIKHAMLLIIGDSYENREWQQTPPLNVNRAVQRLLDIFALPRAF